MLGSTPRVGPTTPPLLALHPLPATHLPPSASWPDGLNRRRLEGHHAIAPPARPARPERAPAAPAASNRPRGRSRGSWSSDWSLPSSGARSELRLILLPNESAREAVSRATSGPTARAPSHSGRERFTVGSGEAAHLFNRLGARTLKMSPVKRRRAGRLDVGTRASSSTLDLHAVGLTPAHSHAYGACAGVSPAFWRGCPQAPARVPAQSPLARRCNRIAHPPTQASAAWRRWSAMPPTRQHLMPVPMHP